MKPIGILSALPEELSSIQKGSIEGIPVVTKLSGMGKVNAAIAAQKLVSEHRVKALIFTGVAGGLSPCLNIGDIVLATQTFEHDFGFLGDTFKLHRAGIMPEVGMGTESESPFYDLQSWPFDPHFLDSVFGIFQKNEHSLECFEVDGKMHSPQIHKGIVATGDQFIANENKKVWLFQEWKASAVEMEGAAVAHVANKAGIPCLILRAISDRAGDEAKFNFQKFLHVVSHNNAALIHELFKLKEFRSWAMGALHG